MIDFEVHNIKEHIYLLNDDDDATGYLIVGNNKALLIDTMYGRVDLKEVAASITSLPIMVINTHGHIDHICGNVYFEQPAFINKLDVPVAEAFYADPDMRNLLNSHQKAKLEWQYVEPKEIIDLGGLTLEVLALPGHTPGSIGLLDRKDRILFSGDAVNAHLWMQLDECLSMEEYLKTLEMLKSIRDEFDYVLTGHSSGLEDAARLDDLERGVREIIAGKTEQDIPYEYFAGVCKAHRYDAKFPDRMIVYKG